MKKIPQSKKDWKNKLSAEEFRVMFEHGTEKPFSGKYYLSKEEGEYVCAACGNPLFNSEAKVETDCGWPSFSNPAGERSVEFKKDLVHGSERIEAVCWRCGAHLGHVFGDPDAESGERFCINSVALKFKKPK